MIMNKSIMRTTYTYGGLLNTQRSGPDVLLLVNNVTFVKKNRHSCRKNRTPKNHHISFLEYSLLLVSPYVIFECFIFGCGIKSTILVRTSLENPHLNCCGILPFARTRACEMSHISLISVIIFTCYVFYFFKVC
jgi:hypothetical protein